MFANLREFNGGVPQILRIGGNTQYSESPSEAAESNNSTETTPLMMLLSRRVLSTIGTTFTAQTSLRILLSALSSGNHTIPSLGRSISWDSTFTRMIQTISGTFKAKSSNP